MKLRNRSVIAIAQHLDGKPEPRLFEMLQSALLPCTVFPWLGRDVASISAARNTGEGPQFHSASHATVQGQALIRWTSDGNASHLKEAARGWMPSAYIRPQGSGSVLRLCR